MRTSVEAAAAALELWLSMFRRCSCGGRCNDNTIDCRARFSPVSAVGKGTRLPPPRSALRGFPLSSCLLSRPRQTRLRRRRRRRRGVSRRSPLGPVVTSSSDRLTDRPTRGRSRRPRSCRQVWPLPTAVFCTTWSRCPRTTRRWITWCRPPLPTNTWRRSARCRR